MAIHIMMRSNHGILTLFKAGAGRMAIHIMMRSNHGILTLFKAGAGRMAIHIMMRSNHDILSAKGRVKCPNMHMPSLRKLSFRGFARDLRTWWGEDRRYEESFFDRIGQLWNW